ncbi:MAG: hypothetical protein K0R62_2044 [Nonomuraea muscovyensis]|jgi:hypothetical protein|nr:hypothetical protein [Nonomuraea muscovyensis]
MAAPTLGPAADRFMTVRLPPPSAGRTLLDLARIG